jgi:hypothetical protein
MKSDVEVGYFGKPSEHRTREVSPSTSILSRRAEVFYSVYTSFSALEAALLNGNYSKMQRE